MSTLFPMPGTTQSYKKCIGNGAVVIITSLFSKELQKRYLARLIRQVNISVKHYIHSDTLCLNGFAFSLY